MKFLTIFFYLITFSYSFATEKPDIKNIVINSKLKSYEEVIFKDVYNNKIDLNNYKGKLLMLNFWATWCAPCKKEMPSLDLLQSNNELNNLKIFPINVGQEDLSKSINFFKNLNIRNLNIYYDSSVILANKFSLRGVPTTILFNKDGKEFARIIGSIDFEDEKFINWLSKYN
jgi:thiol-disulfide isomerase/thioredoxin|tara:strand:- start:802 stop:1317 length:516 start_codon:yes stop_codon:yes gene_type:complete